MSAPDMDEEEIRDRVARALAAPELRGVDIAPSDAVAHVLRVVDPEALASAPIADVVWALALGRGDRAAIARFESEVVSRVAAAVSRVDADPEFASSVASALRIRVLVGDGADAPRALEYAGRGPLAHWALVAAIRLAYDLKRRRGDVEDPVADLDVVLDHDPERAMLRAESRALLKEWIEEALRALDDRRRAVLQLYFVEDVASEAIGKMYGVHRGTVARWIEEAREAVRSHVRRRALATPGLGPEQLESMIRAADGHLSLSLSLLRA
jgi:RNA polymerase sigma-70 factor (ECF subfamily)